MVVVKLGVSEGDAQTEREKTVLRRIFGQKREQVT
jgi:hypothetical protein